ncbi:hypothetical protein ACFE04_018650 [Oxalis oulophora]
MTIAMFECFIILFFLIVVARGEGQPPDCNNEDIDIRQVKSMTKTAKGNPVWDVIITNNCACTILNLRLGCRNFSSTEVIDPAKLVECDAGGCLVNNGNHLFVKSKFIFTYASMTMYPFKPLGYEITCA